MCLKATFLLLILVTVTRARPNDNDYNDLDDEKAQCSIFADKQEYPDPRLNFRCVPELECGRKINLSIVKKTTDLILSLVAIAEQATCNEPKNKCCHEDDIIQPKEGKKCSVLNGYKCVGKMNCGTDFSLVTDSDENYEAVCSDPRSTSEERVCCSESDILKDPEPCSSYPDRRCVSKNKCVGNKVDRRNGGLSGFELGLADDATCPNDSEVCCLEIEIAQVCSEYKKDGFKCAASCFDTASDLPKENDRISTILPFLPKLAKCPQGNICCKRTERPRTVKTSNTCEQSGPGYKCTDFNLCNADTILEKDVNSTVNLLFEGPNLIETNPFGGITINTALSPCNDPQKVCCQPISIGTKTLPPPEPYTTCGVHNPQGLKRGGVAVQYEPSTGKKITSQEGEWPHTCLVLMIDNEGSQETLIGGASLIAPKVAVTAAHIIRKFNPSQIKIRCGEHNLADEEEERILHQERAIKSISIHPLYIEGAENDPKLYNDVAIVHTEEAFDLTIGNVNTICLPDSVNEDNFSENDCHTMGWGTLYDTVPVTDIQNYMKQVILNRVDNEECGTILKEREETTNNFVLHPSFICAGRGGVDKEGNPNDVCKGDGGGPLVCQQQGKDRYVLAGIISWGIGCGKKGVPGVYASVREALCFIDWDTKCKHGLEFMGHYDYGKDCTGWLDKEVIPSLEKYSFAFKNELKRARKLKNSCGANDPNARPSFSNFKRNDEIVEK